MIGVASIVCAEGSRRASRMPLEQAEELPQVSAKSALLLPLAISAMLVLLYLFFHALETFLVFYVCASSAMAVSFTVWPVVHRLGAVLRPLSSAAASWLLAFAAVGSWLWTGHWAWNNILGSCLCVTMISLVRLPNLRVASLCLGALFVYDVFWVFGSARLFGGKNVMVDVATKSAANPLASMGIGAAAGELQLPFKLMFPGEMGWAAVTVVALSEKSSAAAQAAGASGAVAEALPASSAALGGAADLRDTQAKTRTAGAAAAAVAAAAAAAGQAAATPSVRTKALATATAVEQEAFLMIGLGDIALPGIFLAFARRCDSHARRRYRRLLSAREMGEHGRDSQEKSRGSQRSRPPHPRFFSACLAAYVFGLALAVYCSREWNMAQPALMYLVPAVIGSMVWQAQQHAMLRTVWHDVPEQVDRSNADSNSSSRCNCGDGDEDRDSGTTLLAKSG
jgi:hypothetical protein